MKIPHIYQDISGWFSFQDYYSSIVQKFPSGSRLVEVGTYFGCSFSYLVIEAINSGKEFDIIGMDAAPEGWGVEENFDKNMKPFEGKFTKMFGGNSSDRIKEFEDASIDFIFIDANHTYEFVRDDIAAALPKMKPGGIISGHDYNDCHPGCVIAVDEAFGDRVVYNAKEDVWSVQL